VQHVEVEHQYQQSPQAVWDVYTDHAGWKEWAAAPGACLVKEGVSERNGTGAVRGFIGGLREEILDFEAPKRMTYRVTAGSFPIRNHHGEVELEPVGEGTRLIWRCRFESKIPGLGALLQRYVSWTFSRSLAGMARHMATR
jgi:uncharacterized protein YndB with AHSA1/START domain